MNILKKCIKALGLIKPESHPRDSDLISMGFVSAQQYKDACKPIKTKKRRGIPLDFFNTSDKNTRDINNTIRYPKYANLRSKMKDVRDQGDAPSCVAMAATAILEYIKGGKEYYSPQYFMYNNYIQRGEIPDRTYLDDQTAKIFKKDNEDMQMIEILLRHGVCYESDLQYEDGVLTKAIDAIKDSKRNKNLLEILTNKIFKKKEITKEEAINNIISNEKVAKHDINEIIEIAESNKISKEEGRFLYLNGRNPNVYKASISNNDKKPMPVIFATQTFSTWDSKFTTNTGWVCPPPNEKQKRKELKEDDSLHAMLAVGYQDDEKVPGGGYIIAKNSWGSEWGHNGYALIPYLYIKEYAAPTAVTVIKNAEDDIDDEEDDDEIDTENTDLSSPKFKKIFYQLKK